MSLSSFPHRRRSETTASSHTLPPLPHCVFIKCKNILEGLMAAAVLDFGCFHWLGVSPLGGCLSGFTYFLPVSWQYRCYIIWSCRYLYYRPRIKSLYIYLNKKKNSSGSSHIVLRASWITRQRKCDSLMRRVRAACQMCGLMEKAGGKCCLINREIRFDAFMV